MAKADAGGILAALQEGLAKIGVKDTNIVAKCIACNFDGASVNQGRKNGVVIKLKTMVDHVLVSMWCVSHKLELAGLMS